MSRGRILILLQWGVSIALVWFLLSKIDFEQSLHALRNVHVGLLALAVLQSGLQFVLGALRWAVTVRALGGRLPFAASLRYVWIGTFFSQALPGVIGGDLIRMWLFWRDGAGHRIAINSVLLGTVIMMLALFLVVALVQPGLAARSNSMLASWLPFLMLFVAVAGVGVLMVADRLVSPVYHLRAFRAISYLSSDARAAFLDAGSVVALLALSILAYANMAVTAWLIGQALGLAPALMDYLVLFPVVVLAATLPVSVGGWGVRESAIVILFSTVGVAAPHALALGLLFGLGGIVISLPGLALWVGGGFGRSEMRQATRFRTEDVREGQDR